MTMEQLPFAVLSEMVEYLNPRERQRLSAANREMRKLFPSPLRIKISSKSVGCSLEEMYFVSPKAKPETVLSTNDALIYEQEDYLLWTYDYTRENKVYLGRNNVEWGDTGTFQYLIFSVGLRPKDTRQSIRIVGGKDGAHVQFGDDVGITLGGLDANPTSADSMYRTYLSVRGFGDFARWYSMVQEWGKDERLQILPCEDYDAVDSMDTAPQSSSLTIHAKPDIVDGIFHLYGPECLKLGTASSEMVYHKIGCHVWIESGYLCARTMVDSMPCSFAVPIVETDFLQGDIQSPTEILQLFYDQQDARWEAIKYYWAIALDLTCGRSHSLCEIMASLASCDTSGTSAIAHDPTRSMVFLQVDDYLVSRRVPDCPVKKDELWECLVLDESFSFPWIP